MNDGNYHGMGMSEDGHILAQCVSSSVDWLMKDLGAVDDKSGCGDRANARYAEQAGSSSYEVVWVDDPESDVELAEVRKRRDSL